MRCVGLIWTIGKQLRRDWARQSLDCEYFASELITLEEVLLHFSLTQKEDTKPIPWTRSVAALAAFLTFLFDRGIICKIGVQQICLHFVVRNKRGEWVHPTRQAYDKGVFEYREGGNTLPSIDMREFYRTLGFWPLPQITTEKT